MKNKQYYQNLEGSIAVIGMSGAFSKSKDIEEYWQNILNARECMDELTEDDLQTAGIPRELYNNPHYVRRTANLESAKEFDPAFFGYTQAEARLMDPQHRLFLEHSWKCLEDGNIIPEEYDGLIGVFGGCSQNNYLLKNLIYSDQADKAGAFQMMLGNDKDYLTTKVSYKLNLKGPSITMQTACSTSLTAIQQGCLSLLNYQSDMVLSGGASVNVPYKAGYLYQDGLIFSPDGVCRTFDAEANGTVFGDGVGVVLLKRLEDALDDENQIYAIIRGSAINNDGSEKVGYTAPSVKAQSEAIATALAVAEVPADTIGYVEAHGTGTLMGDPIEIAALTDAFRMSTEKKGYCAIGSVKPNIGHLDAAAGVAGFIKAVLVVNRGIIPPQTNYNTPNPALNLENSPFVVNHTKKEWKRGDFPRRATVNSLGVGGTNVHLVLEEYNSEENSVEKSNKPQLQIFSAKSEAALYNLKTAFLPLLEKDDTPYDSLAFTLQKKRVHFPFRDFIVTTQGKKVETEAFINQSVKKSDPEKRDLAFLFTGQGSQYPQMGRGLYENIPFIKKIMDDCFSHLQKERNLNLKPVIFPTEREVTISEEKLMLTGYTQPALFILEYSLARYLMELGLKPVKYLGHSLGEYTAACLSGIFSLNDALCLVSDRGRLMQSAPRGSMISVHLSVEETELLLPSDNLQISVINTPDRCVLSGTEDEVQSFKNKLDARGIQNSLLRTSHAYHSYMMDSILEEFSLCLDTIPRGKPSIPLISNKTGKILSEDVAKSKEYWVNQLRETVNFTAGISRILENEAIDLLEIGPGNTLCTLTKSHPAMSRKRLCLNTIRTPKQSEEDYPHLLKVLGKLWQNGYDINWDTLYEKKPPFIRIPSYQFERKTYWIESANRSITTKHTEEELSENVEKNKSLEQQVFNVWSEIFGDEITDPQLNFYDMGGHSILATQLLGLLNETFQVEIGMGALLMDPTPANSFALIEWELSQKKPLKSNTPISSEKKVLPMMFPVQQGNTSKLPLFMVAGLYFNRYDHESKEEGMKKYEDDYFRYFSTLVKNIGPQQPIFGFRPKGIFLYEKAHKNIKEMAASYILEMKKVQPEGPYLIGGECIGGIIALEMAQQLLTSGEKVKHLILLDTFYPRGKWLKIDSFYIIRNRIINELGQPFREKDLGNFRKIGHFFSQLQQFILPLTKKQRAIRNVNYGNIFYLIKLLKYKPQPYRSPEATIIANEEWAEGMNKTLEWKEKHFNPLNVIPIPGNHVTSLTDFGPVTGNLIREIIEKE
jgi:acyl transferase domain-containing protein/thioesterase domain-containing protein